MIRRKTPFGFRTCQSCGNRMIQGHEVACSWCLREMTEQQMHAWINEFWAIRFLVPTVPNRDATPRNASGRQFLSLVKNSMPDMGLTREQLEVGIMVVSRKLAVDLLGTADLVLEGLRAGGLILYSDQAKVLSCAHHQADNPRTEVTVRRLHPDEIG
jgi:hypothetical protein